jgi:medium-chain acyl-[acyl-carrier-protein] hydrolase
MQRQTWFTPYHPRTPRMRLFCFPSAGKGAAGYTNWRWLFPETVEVLPAKLPGREGRFREEPFTRFPELVEQLAAHVEPLLDVPFAVFGHSLGALVAFELARLLRGRGKPLPRLLLVAARPAPHLRTTTPIWHLPRDQFLSAIQDRYGEFDREIKDHPEILDRFEPILRADFTLFDNYVYGEQAPLDCPIHAYGGSRDAMTSAPLLQAWGRHTVAGCACRIFPGNHFFFEKDRTVLEQLVADIAGHLIAPEGGECERVGVASR